MKLKKSLSKMKLKIASNKLTKVQQTVGALFIAVVVVVGAIFVFASHAASPSVVATASSGTLTSPATVTSSSSAGSYVQFGKVLSGGGGWPNNWILAASTMNNVSGYNSTVANAAFNNSGTYLTAALGSNNPVPSGWRSVPTLNLKSYADFSSAVSSGTVPSWTKAVLYDPEAWTQTPTNEQQDVVTYIKLFCQLAHAHNWLCIITPGTDLMNVYPKNSGETNQQAFVRYNIDGQAAAVADMVQVQSQTDEFSPTSYASYVSQVYSEVKAANANIPFLSGITANDQGTVASGSVMAAAANSVKSYVNGFFLNASSTAPDPADATSFLQLLGY